MKFTRLDQLIGDLKTTKGRWELTPNHELRYRSLDKDEEIKFKGSLIAAEPDALVISVTGRQTDQKVVTRIVKLAGTWRLDPQNRIVFEVEKENGKNDVLTFTGAWRTGKSPELVYSYRQTELVTKRKTRRKVVRDLVFRGWWDISERDRLTYWLGADSNSAFRFRGAFQTRSILAKQNQIRYQAGAELAGRHKTRTLLLFGKWKVSHELDLSFEMKYADGRRRSILFQGEYAPSRDERIIVGLRSERGEPLGVELVLTKEFLGGEAFLRLARSIEESRLEAGVRLQW